LLKNVLSGDAGRTPYQAACDVAELVESDIYTVATWIAGSQKIPLAAAKRLKGLAFNPALLRHEVSTADWAEAAAVEEVLKFFHAQTFDEALANLRRDRDSWRNDPWLSMKPKDLEDALDNGLERPEYLEEKAAEFNAS